ncbi:hypothetical protein ACF0H5_023804 [Mactra antiquata]
MAGQMWDLAATPIGKAIEAGDVNEVHRLVKNGENILYKDRKQNTYIHYICTMYKPSVFYGLISHGIDISAQNRHGNTALHVTALQHECCHVADLMTCGIDPAIKNNDGKTADQLGAQNKYWHMIYEKYKPGIFQAVKDHDIPTIHRLLRCWIRVDAKYKKQTLRQYAACLKFHDIVVIIDEQKATTDMIYGVFEGNHEKVKQALKKTRCRVNFLNEVSVKRHILQYALKFKDQLFVQMLCDAGADVNISVRVNNYFHGPMYFEALHKDISLEMLWYVLKSGADFTLKDEHGRNAFMYALDKVNGFMPIEIFTYMLNRGTDITERDCTGCNARDIARFARRQDVVDLIDKHYIKIIRNSDVESLIQMAVDGYDSLMIKHNVSIETGGVVLCIVVAVADNDDDDVFAADDNDADDNDNVNDDFVVVVAAADDNVVDDDDDDVFAADDDNVNDDNDDDVATAADDDDNVDDDDADGNVVADDDDVDDNDDDYVFAVVAAAAVAEDDDADVVSDADDDADVDDDNVVVYTIHASTVIEEVNEVHSIIKTGDISEMRRLVDYSQTPDLIVKTRNKARRTPLIQAVLFERQDLVEFFLSSPYNVEIDAQDCCNRTAYHFACCLKSDIGTNIQELLLDAGADTTIIDVRGDIGEQFGKRENMDFITKEKIAIHGMDMELICVDKYEEIRKIIRSKKKGLWEFQEYIRAFRFPVIALCKVLSPLMPTYRDLIFLAIDYGKQDIAEYLANLGADLSRRELYEKKQEDGTTEKRIFTPAERATHLGLSDLGQFLHDKYLYQLERKRDKTPLLPRRTILKHFKSGASRPASTVFVTQTGVM